MRIRSFSLANTSLVSLMLLLGLGGAQRAVAQLSPLGPGAAKEVTTNDSTLPLVYSVENSGATSVTPAFPSFANLPIIRPLPDPFRYISTGVRDTSFAGWEQHRNEILNGFENYMVGPKPDCHDCTITASFAYTSGSTTKGTLTVNVTRNVNGTNLTTTLTSAVTLPAGTPPANGWPFVMSVDGSGYNSAFPSASVATIPFTTGQVTSSDKPSATDGFYKLYPTLCSNQCSTSLPAITGTLNNGNSGQFAAWAWGISRLLDGIQIAAAQASNPLPVSVAHSAITGCSYAGKIALYGGVMDERIALTASEENGGGGVGSWRYEWNANAEVSPGTGTSSAAGGTGSVEDIDTTDPHWWSGSLLLSQFGGPNVYKLPIDLHEVASLVAPRALIESGNVEYYWLASESNYVSARAVQQVYNTLGIGDRFGFIVNGAHSHCSPSTAETAAVASFVNRYVLNQSGVNTDVEIYPNGPGQPTTPPSTSTATNPPNSYPVYFPTMDYKRWTSWWGTDDAEFANDWNTGANTDLSFNNPVTISTGDTIQAGYAIQMAAANHPAATVKLPNASVYTDVNCSDGSSYTLWVPLYKTYGTGPSYAIAAGDNSWYPSADATNAASFEGSISGTGGAAGTNGKTVVSTWNFNYAGSTINPGCANGLPGTAGRAYLTVLGVATSNGTAAGRGFITTDTTQSPIVVKFHLKDATTGKGGAWSPQIVVNQLPVS